MFYRDGEHSAHPALPAGEAAVPRKKAVVQPNHL